MIHKYFTTISELIDDYTPFPPITLEEALIHAYELGYKHATEEEQPNPAEFDSNYEQEPSND